MMEVKRVVLSLLEILEKGKEMRLKRRGVESKKGKEDLSKKRERKKCS